MTLIKSISGIRGTIGGYPGDNLSPADVVKYTAAFCHVHQTLAGTRKIKVVTGRDARVSGPVVEQLVHATLVSMGAQVLSLGLSTTPTVEMGVTHYGAQAGIILTASHNPAQWNALKLLNHLGEFISAETGAEVLRLGEAGVEYAPYTELGSIEEIRGWDFHLQAILDLPEVDQPTIAAHGLKVVVDGINSSGSIYVPQLLEALGVQDITVLNAEPHGRFAHNPEPLAEHLQETCAAVKTAGAHLGIVVDPDVDRLAFITEEGILFGEEYTLVAIADYLLSKKPGVAVSNLSSTRALRDVAQRHGSSYEAAAVGEVNVVEKMKQHGAIIGGEGNGGVILPDLHYGRDALVGIALFLSHYVQQNKSMSALRASYPAYFMGKKKVDLTPETPVDAILQRIAQDFSHEQVNLVDGVKIDFKDHWVHLRKSNTEPIIRIYTEAFSQAQADQLADTWINTILEYSKA